MEKTPRTEEMAGDILRLQESTKREAKASFEAAKARVKRAEHEALSQMRSTVQQIKKECKSNIAGATAAATYQAQ